MHAKPVRRYEVPRYPTRAEAALESDLLHALPPAWQGTLPTPLVAFFLALGTAACGAAGAQRPGPAAVVTVPSPPASATAEPEAAEPKDGPSATVVAPIFEHGEGRGAVGCVVINPPVFLSEEEAMTVIREQLARHGVLLRDRNVTFDEVLIPQQQEQYLSDPNGGLRVELSEVPGSAKPLRVDGVDPQRHVAVEYVSTEHYTELGGPRAGSTVQDFNTHAVATELAEKLRAQGRHGVYFGILYDPIPSQDAEPSAGSGHYPTEAEWQARAEKLASQSKALLRAQVEDFVAWLAAHGVR